MRPGTTRVDGRDTARYDWCVYVSSPAEQVRKIARVRYKLHETFREPLQVIDTPDTRFCLLSSGWGEFTIRIIVVFLDGSTVTTTHYLKLFAGDDWPRPPTPPLAPGSPEHRMVTLMEDARDYRWRTLEVLAKRAGISKERAGRLLADLAERGICRECVILNSDSIYGACSIVGVLPHL
jgi:hypothetical protein